jgi:hypothetical protein
MRSLRVGISRMENRSAQSFLKDSCCLVGRELVSSGLEFGKSQSPRVVSFGYVSGTNPFESRSQAAENDFIFTV